MIDLPDDELAAVTAAIRGLIEGDRFPHARRKKGGPKAALSLASIPGRSV
jgi:hypothetical protein